MNNADDSNDAHGIVPYDPRLAGAGVVNAAAAGVARRRPPPPTIRSLSFGYQPLANGRPPRPSPSPSGTTASAPSTTTSRAAFAEPARGDERHQRRGRHRQRAGRRHGAGRRDLTLARRGGARGPARFQRVSGTVWARDLIAAERHRPAPRWRRGRGLPAARAVPARAAGHLRPDGPPARPVCEHDGPVDRVQRCSPTAASTRARWTCMHGACPIPRTCPATRSTSAPWASRRPASARVRASDADRLRHQHLGPGSRRRGQTILRHRHRYQRGWHRRLRPTGADLGTSWPRFVQRHPGGRS